MPVCDYRSEGNRSDKVVSTTLKNEMSQKERTVPHIDSVKTDRAVACRNGSRRHLNYKVRSM